MRLQHDYRVEIGRKRCEVCRVYYPADSMFRKGIRHTGWWIVRNGNMQTRMCTECHKQIVNSDPIKKTEGVSS